jgi:hypothetical protein
MRCLFVCADDFLWRLASDRGDARLAPVWIVEQPRLRARIRAHGGEALAGRLDDEGLYRRAFRTGSEPVLLALERARLPRVIATLRRVAPAAPLKADIGQQRQRDEDQAREQARRREAHRPTPTRAATAARDGAAERSAASPRRR